MGGRCQRTGVTAATARSGDERSASPATAERWTVETTRVAGVDIPPGEFVGVSILGANRDPAFFADPLGYDLGRANAVRAPFFLFGLHACLGLHLARLQTTIALRRTLDRLPGLCLEHADEPAGFAFRRPATMRMRWSAEAVRVPRGEAA